MKKSMRSLLWIAVSALAVGWSPAALAAGAESGAQRSPSAQSSERNTPKKDKKERKAERKALSEAQKAERAAQRKELAAAVRSGNVAKVAQLEAQHKRGKDSEEKRTEHNKRKAEKLAELHAKLTPQQRTEQVNEWLKRDEKHAQREQKRGDRGPLAELNLSAAQRARLKLDQDPQGLQKKRAEVLKRFANAKFDAQAFVQAKHALRPSKPQLSEVVKVLTPQQREKLAERLEQAPSKREHRR